MFTPKLMNTNTTQQRTPPMIRKTKGVFTNGKSTFLSLPSSLTHISQECNITIVTNRSNTSYVCHKCRHELSSYDKRKNHVLSITRTVKILPGEHP